MTPELDPASNDDQAGGLRVLVNAHRRDERGPAPSTAKARCVAVASGKGGVGKTFLSTNLAVLAARRGVRVLLIDGDLGLANVDVILQARARYTIEDVIEGTAGIRDAIADGPSGVKILAAGSGVRALADLDGGSRRRILEELALVEQDFDLVLIDCGAGIGGNVMFFASAASTCVLTVNAEPTCLIDAYAAVKALSQVGVDAVDVVVNCAMSDADARDSFGRLAAVAGRFLPVRLRFAGGVPRDESVRRAVMARRAVVDLSPNASASLALARVERRVLDGADGGAGGRLSVFWDRMFRESAG